MIARITVNDTLFRRFGRIYIIITLDHILSLGFFVLYVDSFLVDLLLVELLRVECTQFHQVRRMHWLHK